MTQRFYPRSDQGRQDAILNTRFHGDRNDQAKRSSISYYDGECTAVATGTARPCNESDIVTGAMAVVWDLSGPDAFRGDIATARFTTLIAGLAVASTAPVSAIVDVLSGSHFVLSANNRRLTLTLPAVAAYSIGAAQTYPWTFDKTLFTNRQTALTVSSCINVANEA